MREKIYIELTDLQIEKIKLEGKITFEVTKEMLPIQRMDFLKLYKQYPRKLGKQKGLDKLKKTVRTEAQYKKLEEALKIYLRYVHENDIEERFIRHFDTWVNSWEDWLDVLPGNLPIHLDWKKVFE